MNNISFPPSFGVKKNKDITLTWNIISEDGNPTVSDTYYITIKKEGIAPFTTLAYWRKNTWEPSLLYRPEEIVSWLTNPKPFI